MLLLLLLLLTCHLHMSLSIATSISPGSTTYTTLTEQLQFARLARDAAIRTITCRSTAVSATSPSTPRQQ